MGIDPGMALVIWIGAVVIVITAAVAAVIHALAWAVDRGRGWWRQWRDRPRLK